MNSDFEKIGAKAIECLKHNGRWVFRHNGSLFDLAPAIATDYALSPIVWGIDRLLATGVKMRSIDDAEKGCLLIVSEGFIPKSDVKMTYLEPQFDGWLYQVEEMNLKGLLPEQRAWICPYLKYYFTSPPLSLHVKIEGLSNGI